jgi:Arc/MetJ family transcription regulator
MSILMIHTDTHHLDEGCIEMRTTLNIDDELVEKASELTGIKEKTTLVKLGLEALIARESARRLAELGGTEKQLKAIPRRRVAEQ